MEINVPGSQVTGPLRMNDRAHVVGLYVDAGAEPDPDGPAPPSAVHGFVWRDGDVETVDVPGAAATFLVGINNRGQMVGSYIDAEGAYHGFVRDRRGRVTTLPEAPGAEPTAGGTQPTSINERGQIVGLAYDAQGGSRAFRYENGKFSLVDGTPGAVFTRPLDVDNRGRAVGDYGTRPAGAPAADAATTGAGDRGEMVIPQPVAMLDPPRDRS